MGFLFVILAALLGGAVASASRRAPNTSSPAHNAAAEAASSVEWLAPHTCRFTLTPGLERFVPVPLPEGECFLVTLVGFYQYQTGSGKWAKADACYHTSDATKKNFTRRYNGLHLDRAKVISEPQTEDHHLHTYAFTYTGTGKKLSLLLVPPCESAHTLDTLDIYVEPRFTPEEQAQQQAERERQAAEAARQKLEAEQRAEEERQCDAEAQHEARLYGLGLRFDLFPHYADPEFIRRIATISQKSLLDRREEILQGHFALHEDRDFITYVQERRPDLYERAIWQVKALALAEQLAAEPPTPALSPPRPKLTPEERQARIERFRTRMLDRQRVQAEDNIAKIAQRLSLRREFRAMLDETEELDEDQKEQIAREFDEHISDEEDNNGFKKL